MDSKVAIILQAGRGTHEGLARAFHSLIYAKELKEHGAEVRLVFDGAGTEWPSYFRTERTMEAKGLGGLLDGLKADGLVYEICDYCSASFGVKEALEEQGEPLSAQYMDHPSIAALVAEDYRILVL